MPDSLVAPDLPAISTPASRSQALSYVSTFGNVGSVEDAIRQAAVLDAYLAIGEVPADYAVATPPAPGC